MMDQEKRLAVGLMKTNELLKENLDSFLTSMNISPLKMHSVTSHSRVIGKIKEKILRSNHNQKIQLLTLVLISWSNKYIEVEFNVTNCTVQISRKLLQKKGILSFPEDKKKKKKEKKYLKRK